MLEEVREAIHIRGKKWLEYAFQRSSEGEFPTHHTYTTWDREALSSKGSQSLFLMHRVSEMLIFNLEP